MSQDGQPSIVCMQFYAMTSFCNPGVFGSSAQYRKYYERPILAGREPGATDLELQLAAERKAEMSKQCDEFVLRRTNDILSDHLPPKVIATSFPPCIAPSSAKLPTHILQLHLYCLGCESHLLKTMC